MKHTCKAVGRNPSCRIFTEAEIAFLLSHYHYDPLTGQITLPCGRILKRTNKTHYDYVETSIGWITAHRLAWILYYGEPPKFTIDHINGNKYDNRIINLRDVPQAVNNKNRHKSTRTTFRSISSINEENVFYTYLNSTRVGRKFYNIDDAVVFRLKHGLEI